MFPGYPAPSSSHVTHPSTFSSSLTCEPCFDPLSAASDLFSIHTPNRSFPFSSHSSSGLQPPAQPLTYGWPAPPPRAPVASFSSSFGFSDAPGFSARVTVNSYASPSAKNSNQFFPDTSFNAPSMSHAPLAPSNPQPTNNNLVHLAAILQMVNRAGSNNSEFQAPQLPVQQPQPAPTSTADTLLRLLENALKAAPITNNAFPSSDVNTFNNTPAPFSTDAFLPLQPFSSLSSSFVPAAQAPVPPPTADPGQLTMLLNLFAAAKAKQSQNRSIANLAQSEASSLGAPSLDGLQVPSSTQLNQAAWKEFTAPSSSEVPMVQSSDPSPAQTASVKPEPADWPSSPGSETSANQWESSPAPSIKRPRQEVKKSGKTVKKEGGSALTKKKKTKRSRLHRSGKDLEFLSEIVCGTIENPAADFTVKDVQETRVFEPFFGREVEVFTAVKDPERRPLYQTTELTKALKCSNNMLAMYLARRKRLVNSGIYQATSILYKRNCRKDVKCSGYFITLEACRRFSQYLEQRKIAAQVKAEEERLVNAKDHTFFDSSPADSIITTATESSVIGDDRLLLPASIDIHRV